MGGCFTSEIFMLILSWKYYETMLTAVGNVTYFYTKINLGPLSSWKVILSLKQIQTNTEGCMFLSCHVHVSEWSHTL